MPSIVYERCQQIIQLCKDQRYFKEIPIDELRQIISQNIAGDPRQIKLYLSRLQYFGFMKALNPKVMQIQPKQVNKEEVQKQQLHIDEMMLKQWGIGE